MKKKILLGALIFAFINVLVFAATEGEKLSGYGVVMSLPGAERKPKVRWGILSVAVFAGGSFERKL
ncbi:MAG: hypothetical protein LBQ14_08200 [Treponema sp.]|jgi:hypothetical protein|nr:hypothetical protein [Treponema sp.]